MLWPRNGHLQSSFLCPALSYCHPSPPTPSRNLSSLILKLNRSLVAKLSPPSLSSVMSEEVIQRKLCGLFTLICSLSVLSFSTGSSPSFVFALLFPSISLDFLAGSWAVALQGSRSFIHTLSPQLTSPQPMAFLEPFFTSLAGGIGGSPGGVIRPRNGVSDGFSSRHSLQQEIQVSSLLNLNSYFT